MGNEQHLLNIRLRMESLISEREMMIAMNQERESKGYAQAYGEESFHSNSQAFIALAHEL